MRAFYHIALFIHVTGVLALFIASSFEVVSLAQLRGAQTTEEAREAGKLAMLHVKMITPAALAVFLGGLYMTVAAWKLTTPWIDVALALVLLHAILARAFNAPRARAIHARLAKAPGGPLSPEARRRLSAPVLNAVVEIMFAQTVGIVFLMTVKPALVGALLDAAITTVIGLIPSLWRWIEAALVHTERRPKGTVLAERGRKVAEAEHAR